MENYLPPLTPVSATLILAVSVLIWMHVSGSRIHAKAEGDTNLNDITLSNLGGGVIFGVAVLLMSSGNTISDFWFPALFRSRLPLFFAALLVAAILFIVRNKARSVYAAIEIVGAIGTLYIATKSTSVTDEQKAVALAGAVYFLIRGFDNAQTGGLWGRLLKPFRGEGGQARFFFIIISLAMIMAIITVWYGSVEGESRRTTDYPYMVLIPSMVRVPVSPLACGNPFVYCDRAAWQDRERLVNGSEADRQQAEEEAARRRNAPLLRR